MTLPNTLSQHLAPALRARANRLRFLALQLEGATALGLATLAGPTTWVGPTPDQCAADMRAMRTNLMNNAGWLRMLARRLDQQAIAAEQNPDNFGPR